MEVLFEDKNIIVCQKAPGEVSELSDMLSSPANDIRNKYGYAGIIHRLDQNVGGAILYAKNKNAAAKYSELVRENKLVKEYLAIVHGVPEQTQGELNDLLFKDSKKNKVFVVKKMRKGVRDASLYYKVIETVYEGDKAYTLVHIKLNTGRSHQIRVQFASRKMPLAGDGKYGSRNNKCEISLWSHSLSFVNPYTNIHHQIQSFPSKNSYPWFLFEFFNKL